MRSLVERLAEIGRENAGFYQVFPERRYQAAMRPCLGRIDVRARTEQRGMGGVEHRVVGAIAGAV